MILLLDNYDSFTYNLHDYIRQLGLDCVVVRNDEKSVDELSNMSFDAAVISPGPKTPAEAGVTMSFIRRFYEAKPILGVCLGHQALGEFFGWKLIKAATPVHGKTSLIKVNNRVPVFNHLPELFEVMRYHSLVLEQNQCSDVDVIAVTTSTAEVMAIQHKNLPLTGLQFHPESILTPLGLKMMKNWFSDVLQREIVM